MYYKKVNFIAHKRIIRKFWIVKIMPLYECALNECHWSNLIMIKMITWFVFYKESYKSRLN